MSDHWKTLANQFGIPGLADPPETEKQVERGASTAVPPADPVPAAPAPQSAPPSQAPRPVEPVAKQTRPVDTLPPRKRTSMWGDDSDSDSPDVDPVTPPPPPTADASPPPRRPDPLEAIVVVDREPPVPGFDVPADRSPGAVKTPVRRSAWDTLIGTLGIRSSSEPVEQPAAVPPKARVESPVAPAREPADRQPQDRQPRDRHRQPDAARRDQAPSRERASDDAGFDAGFGAGLIDEPSSRSNAGPSRSNPDDDRPRGRGRRGGSRRRGRGADRELDDTAKPPVDSDFDWELAADDDDFDAPPEPRRVAANDDKPVAAPFSDAADDEARARPRRSRRRGQRQQLSLEDAEDLPTTTPADPIRAPRSESSFSDRPRRRDDSEGRERAARPPRSRADESSPRSAARPESRRPEKVRQDDDFGDFSDDDLDSFGSGLLADPQPVTEDAEEARPKSRRRRGRRGRGSAGREERGPSEASDDLASEPDDLPALPAFDDDLEDDDEADRLRRRTRGGRSRGGRRAAGDRDVAASDRDPDLPTRGPDSPVDSKSRNVPTWLDTVSLLVDSNIQRRSSGGGNRNPGNPSGRGGRR